MKAGYANGASSRETTSKQKAKEQETRRKEAKIITSKGMQENASKNNT
jgi:hypothetical protein